MAKTNLPQKTGSNSDLDIATKALEKVVKGKYIQKAGNALGEAMSKGIDKLFGVKR